MKDAPDNLTLEQYTAISRAELNKQYKNTKICLYKNIECSKRIIKSHSIQQAALRKIAENRKVLRLFFDVYEADGMPRESYFRFEEISITIASTFNGFCDFHDKQLFEEIEDIPIECFPSQIEKLYFRSTAYRVFGNIVLQKQLPIIIYSKTPKDLPRMKERDFVKENIPIQESVLNEMRYYLEETKTRILNKQYLDYNFLFFRLDSIPDIMCCTFLIPAANITQKYLFKFVRDSSKMEICSLTISADTTGGYVCFIWDKSFNSVSEFIKQWYIDGHDFNKIILEIFITSDNYYCSKKWWESLSYIKRKQIMKYVSSYRYNGFNNFVETSQYEAKEDWRKYINWNVIEMKSNFIIPTTNC